MSGQLQELGWSKKKYRLAAGCMLNCFQWVAGGKMMIGAIKKLIS